MGIKRKLPLISKIVVVTIGLFFIKNIALVTMNQLEIKRLRNELYSEKKINLTLIDEIKAVKTDSFVIRYAVDNLNLRPSDDDLVDLIITTEELEDIKLRIDSGLFGKKFENVPVPSDLNTDSEKKDVISENANDDESYINSEKDVSDI